MKSGDIEVQFIPKNAEEARVLVKNKTKQPLRIEMPAAFAGVPVLAQFGGGGMGGGGMGGGGMGGGGGGQGMGGGMGGGGMGGGMGVVWAAAEWEAAADFLTSHRRKSVKSK